MSDPDSLVTVENAFARFRSSRTAYLALVALFFVVAAAGFVLAVEEVRYFVGFELFPETARDASFDQYTAPSGTTVFHLGTIHGRHLNEQAYGLQHLEAVIQGLQPDLLMVEVLPTELDEDNPGAGPIEMPVVTLIARREGVSVAGIDWWSEPWLEGQTSENRDDKMFEHLQAALPASGKVLVLTGYSHFLEFRSRYAANGFTRESFSDAQKHALFEKASDSFRLPDGLDATLARAIASFQARIESTESENLKGIYGRKVKRMEAFRETLTARSE